MIYESGWSSITVKEENCYSLFDDLVISNDNCLQYIYLQGYTLSNIQSVILFNLPNLTTFNAGNKAFFSTTSLILDSIFNC